MYERHQYKGYDGSAADRAPSDGGQAALWRRSGRVPGEAGDAEISLKGRGNDASVAGDDEHEVVNVEVPPGGLEALVRGDAGEAVSVGEEVVGRKAEGGVADGALQLLPRGGKVEDKASEGGAPGGGQYERKTKNNNVRDRKRKTKKRGGLGVRVGPISFPASSRRKF